jgi:hypothetical protein
MFPERFSLAKFSGEQVLKDCCLPFAGCGVAVSIRTGYRDGMNPKAAEVWDFALAKMESARRYIEQEQDGPAKTQIAKAVYVGAGALYYLLGQGPEEQAAHQAAQSFITEMTAMGGSAAEAYMAARKILTYIAEISPAEDKLPAP